MSERKETQLATRIVIGLFAAIAAAHGLYAQTPAGAEVESCCLTGSSRGALLATATAETNGANADRAKSRKTGAPNISTKGWPAKPWPEGMVWIPGGEFSMGAVMNGHGSSEMPMASNDAEPIHRVFVDGFWMDTTTVTNEQFEKFVRETGYVTTAERAPTKEEFPTAPAENLVAGSVVFAPTGHEVPLNDYLQWWSYVKGATWRRPLGPDSDITGKDNYPVVHVAYPDAEAYAKWAGKRLPTEAEFEFAARGGLVGKTYVWGDEFRPGGKWMANTWQGKFPVKDAGEDGYAGIAPVKSFSANGYGLYDMSGNVWQWCSDWYRTDYYKMLADNGGVARNPQGPDESLDPSEPGVKKRVHRGGSFLCNDQYCSRYIVGTRGKGEVETGTNHLGFRAVMTPAAWAERQKENPKAAR
jgi:formylglycine-generating enzyme required for sulfatase activity